MRFLRTLFWIVVAVVAVLFAANNWTPVSVNIGNGLFLDTKLSALVIGAFLLGLVPMAIAYHAVRWRYQRRLAATAERIGPTDDEPGLAAGEPRFAQSPAPAAAPSALSGGPA